MRRSVRRKAAAACTTAGVLVLAGIVLVSVPATGLAAARRPAGAASNGMIGFGHRVPGNDGSFAFGTVNPDGSGLHIYTGGASAPVFSPDGNKMIVSRFPS